MKIPLTSAGIELATFRFVAQHLKHCATAVPYVNIEINISCVVCSTANVSVNAWTTDPIWSVPQTSAVS